MRWLYLIAVYLAAPLHAASLAMRARSARHRRGARLAERFGFGAPLAGRPVWIHAASVGEVQAASTLVKALRTRRPDLPILLTAFTPTGAARAASLGPGVTVRYLPYDLPGSVRRFLDRARPRLALILETELWPTLFRQCHRRGIPLIIASARLSHRSQRRYRRFGSLLREALRGVVIAAQSETDAARFLAIGADPQRTHVSGNLKFDCTVAPDIGVRGARLRALYAPGRPLWVAGSTHEGEEAVMLAAHRRVCAAQPGALLVIAPRHPQRFETVAALLAQQGVPHVRHSRSAQSVQSAQVLLLDTLGELIDFYAAADAAFVGGSLVPVGGHNLLEPAALGRPIVTGPHQFNAADIAQLLVARGAVQFVRDEAELAATLIAWLSDPTQRAQVGARGQAVVAENRGALERVLALITPLLDSPER